MAHNFTATKTTILIITCITWIKTLPNPETLFKNKRCLHYIMFAIIAPNFDIPEKFQSAADWYHSMQLDTTNDPYCDTWIQWNMKTDWNNCMLPSHVLIDFHIQLYPYFTVQIYCCIGWNRQYLPVVKIWTFCYYKIKFSRGFFPN